MAVRIQVRNGTASEWTTADPVLMEGELGAELDTGFFKIGDGENEWSKLPYAARQGAKGDDGDTWKPAVDGSGNLTWSKASGTPASANIRGPAGSDATATPVVDALDSTSTTSALSAKQGSVLYGMIGDIGSALDTINGEVV